VEKGEGGRECEKINVLSLFLPQVFQMDTNLCVCDFVCVCERERERESVCEKERESERG